MPIGSQSLLNHCAIFSENLGRSVKFYEDAFGLKVKARWTEIGLVTDGNEQRIASPGAHLEDGEGRRIEIFESADSTGNRESQKPINHFAFEVSDVPSAFQNVLAAGVTPDTPPSIVTAGSFRAEVAFLRGPDGERIELIRFL